MEEVRIIVQSVKSNEGMYMKKIALTGTIASGKTTVSILLKRRGLPVFDADGYAHMALYKTSAPYQKIVDTFGNEILTETDEIDRGKLAEIIFHDEEKRKALNAIVHPFVKEGMLRFFEHHQEEALVFAEVPLLYEAGWESLFDEVLLVTCDKDVAIMRMMEERLYTKEMAVARYESQYSVEIQTAKADYIIENNGSIVELNQKLSAFLKKERA